MSDNGLSLSSLTFYSLNSKSPSASSSVLPKDACKLEAVGSLNSENLPRAKDDNNGIQSHLGKVQRDQGQILVELISRYTYEEGISN